jgi:hypothetical protein
MTVPLHLASLQHRKCSLTHSRKLHSTLSGHLQCTAWHGMTTLRESNGQLPDASIMPAVLPFSVDSSTTPSRILRTPIFFFHCMRQLWIALPPSVKHRCSGTDLDLTQDLSPSPKHSAAALLSRVTSRCPEIKRGHEEGGVQNPDPRPSAWRKREEKKRHEIRPSPRQSAAG